MSKINENDGKITRVSENILKEFDEINEKRKHLNLRRASNRELTKMIPRHNAWHKIKDDLIRFKFNKKGLATLSIFVFIFMIFFWAVLLGILLLIFNTINDNIDLDIDIGGANLRDSVRATFGQINGAFINSADLIGYVIIIGMIMTMFMSAYIFRGEFPKLFILIDVVLMIFAYVIAVYISNSYETLITSAEILNVYINIIPKTSTFILNLPKFVGIIGTIIMILSYAGFPRETQEDVLIGGTI